MGFRALGFRPSELETQSSKGATGLSAVASSAVAAAAFGRAVANPIEEVKKCLLRREPRRAGSCVDLSPE